MFSHYEHNPDPQPGPLTPRMREILAEAAGRWDSAIASGDWRTWGALYRRGYVKLLRGRGTNRYGGTAYNVITGLYITDEGREALAT